MNSNFDPSSRPELVELHAHIGGSVAPEIMWTLAHQNGIKLPTRNYWKFVQTLHLPEGASKDKDFHALFKWTETVQSGPMPMERSTYEAVGSFYRSSNVTTLELRFNPMKRNRGGEQDLDQVIQATLRGLEQGTLDYGTKAGIILMLDTRFSAKMNEIIANKAIAFKSKGVVGIDIAGPSAHNSGFSFKDHQEIFAKAKKAGLGITVHAGEEPGTSVEVVEAIEFLGTQRIGHGIHAIDDPLALKLLADSGVVLEICATSNLRRGVIGDLVGLKKTINAFKAAGVEFCICTDNSEMYGTTAERERAFLVEKGVLSAAEVQSCEETARKASFIK